MAIHSLPISNSQEIKRLLALALLNFTWNVYVQKEDIKPGENIHEKCSAKISKKRRADGQ